MISFLCDICNSEFTVKRNLTRHMKNQHDNTWSCIFMIIMKVDNYERYLYDLKLLEGDMSNIFETIKLGRSKDNVNYIGGALGSSLVEYRLDHEHDL